MLKSNRTCFVGQVYTPSGTSLPTSTGVYFAVYPARVTGAPTEGGSGTLSLDTSRTEYVYVVGSTAPLNGDYLVCEWAGCRWVASRMNVPSPGGTFIPGCPCTAVPSTLTMSVSLPASNYGIFQDCTLQYYNPVPSQFASLSLGSFAFLSTASFTDDLSTNPFWYYFACYQGYYSLSRVYEKTSTGPAYVDSIRYRWLAGFFGNTCSPFSLSSGSIFAGGNSACVVTITG